MSNLIKSSSYIPLNDIKKIEVAMSASVPLPDLAENEQYDVLEIDPQLAQLLTEAEQKAEKLIHQARSEADNIRQEASVEVERWWQERRELDDELRLQIHSEAYESGLEEGKQEGLLQAKEQYEAFISEGRAVLEQAYEISRHTVASSEPFLLELSCGIAEKLIARQLELSPEYVLGIVREALKRCSDKGTVTLCVAPGHFAYIQSMREELSLALDAQTELHILPDSSVRDHGCVIKTKFGTVDARIETGLTEIKQALVDLCNRGEEAHASQSDIAR